MDQPFSSALGRYNQLFAAQNKLYHDAALSLGMSESRFWILYTLYGAQEGLSQRALGEIIGMPKQTVNSTVRGLLREGYVLSQRQGREDALRLSPEGEMLAGERLGPIIRRENAAFAALTPREREELLRLTDKYLAALARCLSDPCDEKE